MLFKLIIFEQSRDYHDSLSVLFLHFHFQVSHSIMLLTMNHSCPPERRRMAAFTHTVQEPTVPHTGQKARRGWTGQ